MNLEEFKKANPKTKHGSKIKAFHEDVADLCKNGYSFAAIQEYLLLQGIKISYNSVRVYCNRHFLEKESPAPTVSKLNKQSDKPAPIASQSAPETPKNTPDPSNKPSNASALPSWHIGNEKSLDDLM